MSKKVKSKDEDGSSSLIDHEDDGIDLGAAADEAAGNKASITSYNKSTNSNDNNDDMKYSTLSTSSSANKKRPSILKTSNKRPSLKQRPSLQRSNSSFNQSIRNLRSTLQHSSSQSFRYVILYFVHMICSTL